MIFTAILRKTTKDEHESKLLTPSVFKLSLDTYGLPSDFAKIIENYDEKEMKIEIKEEV